MTTASLWGAGTTDIPSQSTNSSFLKQQFTATAAQTLFTLTDFVYVQGTNSLLVFDNGMMLVQGVDFTETSTSSFTLAVGATVGHKITAYGLVEITGTVVTPGAGTVDTASLGASLLVPISKGGTGQITASAALAALGGTALADNNAWTGTQTFSDNKFQVKDNVDATKILEFQLSGITTGTTRTLSAPDKSGVIAVTSDVVSTGRGVTTVTLTSASPSATLTSTDNEVIKVVVSGTIPVFPSIVLPAMTTLNTGLGYFYFVNTTPYVVAIKGSDGTIRDHLPPYGTVSIAITDISSAAGKWLINNPPCLVGEDVLGATQVSAPSLVNAGYTFTTQAFVRLSATEFAWVWSEYGANFYSYAKLYTITEATRTVTAGNQVTLESAVEGLGTGAGFNWDCDFAGRALLVYNRAGATNSFIVSIGLTASGGTLTASAANTVSNLHTASLGYTYCFYLGSGSAYAYGGTLYDTGGGTYYNYIRGATVTGTTTLTQSASNTSFTANQGRFARTSLTTATVGSTTCKYMNYTPGANTFTTGNRTSTTAILDIEYSTGDIYGTNQGSFGQRGFMYAGTSKAVFGPSVFDVTNVGAAGVTAVASAGFNAKSASHSSYLSLQGYSVIPLKRAGLFTGASGIYYVSCQAMYGSQLGIADTSGTTLDLSVSGVLADAGSGTTDVSAPPTFDYAFPVSAVPLMPRGISYFSGIMCSSSLALLFYLGGVYGRVPINVVFAKLGTSLNG